MIEYVEGIKLYLNKLFPIFRNYEMKREGGIICLNGVMTKTDRRLRQGASKNHKQWHYLIPNCLGYSVLHTERYMILFHS